MGLLSERINAYQHRGNDLSAPLFPKGGVSKTVSQSVSQPQPQIQDGPRIRDEARSRICIIEDVKQLSAQEAMTYKQEIDSTPDAPNTWEAWRRKKLEEEKRSQSSEPQIPPTPAQRVVVRESARPIIKVKRITPRVQENVQQMPVQQPKTQPKSVSEYAPTISDSLLDLFS